MDLSQLPQYFSVANIRHLHEQYEAHLSAVAVLFGFLVDSLTLRRVDMWAEHIVILSYLMIAAVAIVIMHLLNEGKLNWQIFEHADWWVPLIMQFAFGGLFSVFLLFYGRSASITANWPFLLILLALLIGNEFFRRRYRQLTFNLTVWYNAVLAYCIFLVPILVNQIGDWVFLLSGVVSIGVVAGFVRLLSALSSQLVQELQRTFTITIGGVFVLTAALYFSHVIPPIPLSLQEARVAHHVEKTATGNYQLMVEDRQWYDWLTPGQAIHVQPTGSVYMFSSVFAPTDFTTQVTHRWQYRKSGQWITISAISFPVRGGRADGYRGYSQKTNLRSGRWRVLVETPDGRRLGKEGFRVKHTTLLPDRQTITR